MSYYRQYCESMPSVILTCATEWALAVHHVLRTVFAAAVAFAANLIENSETRTIEATQWTR